MRTLALVPLLVATLAPAMAGAVTFKASVDSRRVEVGDTLRLTVSISVPDRGGIEQLTLPGTPDFERVSSSESTQMQFTFGSGGQKVEQVVTHHVVLRATSTGAKTITPGVLKYRGRTYNTSAITITVLKAGQGGGSAASPPPAGRGRQPPDPFSAFGGMDPFDILRGGTGAPANQDDIILRVVTDKSEVWLGEQVTLYVQVLSRLDIADFPDFRMPKLDGFWVEDLNSPSRITPTTKYIDGVPYRAYLLRRKALFPLKSGTLEISPVEVEVAHGFGLFTTGRTVTRRSPPVTLTVKPLPAEGQPKGFPGTNVGRWRISSEVSATEAVLGETISLKLTASGTGNLNSLVLPEVEAPQGLKVYEPTRARAPKIRGGEFGGEKTVEWVLVPTRTGALTLPAMELHYFDVEAGAYRVRTTDPVVLEVTAGDGSVPAAAAAAAAAGAGAAAPVPAGALNVLDASGLRTIRYGGALAPAGGYPWRRGWFLGLLGVPLVLLGLLLLGERLRAVLRRRGPVDPARKATGVARARLKEARRHRRKGALREAFAAVERALIEYVSQKTELPARGLARDTLAASLRERGYAPLRVDRLCQVLEDCEVARFSPGDPGAEEVDRIIDRAARVLEDLESGPAPRRAAA